MCTIPTFCVEKFVNISETQKTKFLHDMQKTIIWIMQGVFKRFKPELNKSYDIVIENDYFIVNGESLNNRQFHSWLKNIL